MESSTTGKSELDGRSPLPILQPHGGERSHHQYQEQEESKGLRSRSPESMLRLLPMVLCIIALVLMLKSSQDSLSYSNLAAFRFFILLCGLRFSNSIVCICQYMWVSQLQISLIYNSVIWLFFKKIKNIIIINIK